MNKLMVMVFAVAFMMSGTALSQDTMKHDNMKSDNAKASSFGTFACCRVRRVTGRLFRAGTEVSGAEAYFQACEFRG